MSKPAKHHETSQRDKTSYLGRIKISDINEEINGEIKKKEKKERQWVSTHNVMENI